jgi:transposase-like protein
MICPVCKTESEKNPYKEWLSGEFKVSKYKCPRCKEKFNLYISEDGSSFTIPFAL